METAPAAMVETLDDFIAANITYGLLVSPADAASLCGVRRASVYDRINNGRLRWVSCFGKPLLAVDDLGKAFPERVGYNLATYRLSVMKAGKN